VNTLPRWRLVAGCLVLVVIALFAILFTPVYVRNMKLQNYVEELTRRAGNDKQPDNVLRGWVLDKARQLALPVTEDNVHIYRTPDSLRIDVSYSLTVHAPLYEVDLHFYPGAGSR
jgi:hypothetical protein